MAIKLFLSHNNNLSHLLQLISCAIEFIYSMAVHNLVSKSWAVLLRSISKCPRDFAVTKVLQLDYEYTNEE